jgi:ubiquinone/menaquinone biosynthesis C-methylase UbiE
MVTKSGFFEGTGMPDPGWWEALWPDPAGVLTSVGLKSDMDVIDLCSGDGWFTLQIAKIAHFVIAIDIDGKLLETARIRLAESKQFNCTFIEGDAYDIPQLVDHQVDFVFLANAFHGVPDKPRLAKAVRSTLKPGGLFAIVNWHARPREETTVLGVPRDPATGMRMSPEAVNAAVRQAAFRLVHIIEIHPYHYASIFAANSN